MRVGCPLTITYTSGLVSSDVDWHCSLTTHKYTAAQSVAFHYVNYNSVRVVNVNVHVYIYSPESDIPVSSADWPIYIPGIGPHSFTFSSPLERIQYLCILLQL